MNKIISYVKESYHELVSEVTWPSWATLQTQTVQVLVASLIIALVLFGMDKLSQEALNLWYGI